MNDDARLAHWLASHRDEVVAGARDADPRGHVDVDTLTRHATGRLSPAQAQHVTEHLLVCEDGRCMEFVRAQASDVDAATDFLYPPEDENASRPRTFLAKEGLWQMILEVASLRGQSVDEIIEEAMVQYAHARGYHEGPTARRRNEASDLEVTQDASSMLAQRSRPTDVFPAPRPAAGAPPSITMTAAPEEDLSESEPSHRGRSAPPLGGRVPATTPEAVPRAPVSVRRVPAALAAPPSRRSLPVPPPSVRSLAPPSSRRAPPPLPSAPSVSMPPSAPRAAMGSMSLAKRLVLTFEGRTYDVDKEHFILGRSKTQADLRIDDANVSRQHAAIERIGSIYYLVDLGSTNGVYVGDDRVTRRALVDGDVIVITTHHISCRLG